MERINFQLVNGGGSVAHFKGEGDWVFIHFNDASGKGATEMVWKIDGKTGSAPATSENLEKILGHNDYSLPDEFVWPKDRMSHEWQRVVEYIIRNSDHPLVANAPQKNRYLQGEWLSLKNIGKYREGQGEVVYDLFVGAVRILNCDDKCSLSSWKKLESTVCRIARYYSAESNRLDTAIAEGKSNFLTGEPFKRLKWTSFAKTPEELISFWRAAVA